MSGAHLSHIPSALDADKGAQLGVEGLIWVSRRILASVLTLVAGCRSGALNAKQRELAELQAQAQRRLKHARANFAEGMQAARETRRDLDYTAKKIS